MRSKRGERVLKDIMPRSVFESEIAGVQVRNDIILFSTVRFLGYCVVDFGS